MKLEAAEGRTDMHLVDPEKLELVEDPASPLYDPRVACPLNEALVLNVMMYGVKEPVLVRKNGQALQVVAGRQRVRAAREANVRFKAAGKAPMLVRCVTERGTDTTMMGIMLAENAVRADDDPMAQAKKVERFLALGVPLEDAAVAIGCSLPAIKTMAKLLSCSKKVQATVAVGKLSVSAAAKLSELPREEQEVELEKLLESGSATVAKVYNAVQKKKGAKEHNGISQARVRQYVEKYGKALPKDAHDALQWTLDGVMHGCIGRTVTEFVEPEEA